MFPKIVPISLLLLAMSSLLPALGQESNNFEGHSSTVLLKSDRSWDGRKYDAYPSGIPELTILKIVIPPNTTLPWHSHAEPNAAYVLSGTLHVETEDGHHQITLNAGVVLPEAVGTIHRGWTEGSPVELIVFYAGAKNLPITQPAK
jgi:quercetin dioxygenase-like cupin family protein